MEAMACGCAVLASRVGGCPELIEQGESGVLVDAGDQTSLTEQLRLLVTNDALRSRLANAAAERMKRFSVAKAAERMGQIYHGYLSQ